MSFRSEARKLLTGATCESSVSNELVAQRSKETSYRGESIFPTINKTKASVFLCVLRGLFTPTSSTTNNSTPFGVAETSGTPYPGLTPGVMNRLSPSGYNEHFLHHSSAPFGKLPAFGGTSRVTTISPLTSHNSQLTSHNLDVPSSISTR